MPRFRAKLALGLALVTALGAATAAQSPPALGQLTPAQREKLKAKLAEQGGKLTPEQREKLKARLEGKKGAGKPAPAATPAKKPVTPTAPPPPRPKPLPAPEVAKLIDAEIDAKLAADNLKPGPLADDAEFLRRVSLDLVGVIPTADEARAFLDSTDPAKREKLIDALLASPNFGRRQADIWTAKLVPRDTDTKFVPREVFAEWFAKRVNEGATWDKLTAEIVGADGPLEENPATVFFIANRHIDKLTDAVGTHFLGVQIACAQCHKHPYTDWKQDDYWGLAAFFEKVQAKPVSNPNRTTKPGERPAGVVEGAGLRGKKDEFFPAGAKHLPPKFLGAEAPTLSATAPYRPALSAWLTTGRTPYFSQAYVNRAWAQLFGRGLVNPVDDLDPDHAATHPKLFEALAGQFYATGFDIKQLYKALALSNAYQRTSKVASAKADEPSYATMMVKVMSPEQLYDSLAAVVPATVSVAAPNPKSNNKALPAADQLRNRREGFVTFYLAGSETPNAAEYEAGIPQALRLMNSRLIGSPKAVEPYAPKGSSPAAAVPELVLAALSRRPTSEELGRFTAYYREHGANAAAYADILWALLNSSEFALVR